MRTAWSMVLLMALAACAQPQQPASECAPGAQMMSVTQMFFGRDIYGKGEVSEGQWGEFVRDTIIPRFPDGFTVIDASGQYLDTKRNTAISEKSKMVIIATDNTPEARQKLDAIATAYKSRFEQQAVGMITRPACASF